MKEHYVSYEQSQALKRLGFDKKVSAVWHFDGEEWNLIPDYGATFQHPKDIPHWNTSKAWGEFIYSAPRLDQAQTWLREKHHLSVEPICNMVRQWNVNVCKIDNFGTAVFSKMNLDIYELALSAGLDAAIELLGKEENNGM